MLSFLIYLNSSSYRREFVKMHPFMIPSLCKHMKHNLMKASMGLLIWDYSIFSNRELIEMVKVLTFWVEIILYFLRKIWTLFSMFKWKHDVLSWQVLFSLSPDDNCLMMIMNCFCLFNTQVDVLVMHLALLMCLIYFVACHRVVRPRKFATCRG